ncbi:ABC transporter ATP-binding protein/permease [Tissierella carlieri]|uniref:ABC transporter ATP-binding protein/permease n=1 Tax=Tissierella carlieri TaxID=689904 RepID=A0ABT1SC51_9FIRM|nr:ABC transporter ATP-binding protein [Tissierella carlieri]MCQ4923552.1 ABC transporter ATP-binding protein/permease [Tissierella carlieri]
MKELLLKRKSRFIFYILACFIPVLDNTLVNLVMSMIIGSIQVGTMENFIRICFISLGVTVLGAVMYIVSRFMRISFMRDTLLDVRLLAFDKILNSSYKEFSKKSKDSYISNLINDINIFESNFFLQLINVIFRGGVYVVSLTIIGFLDIKFAIGAFVISIILFFISKSFESKTVKLQEEVSEYNENFAIEMSNTFNGLEILKLNNIEDRFLSKALKSITGLERKKFEFNIYTDSQRRIMEFLGFGFLIGSMVYLSTLLGKGMSLTKVTFMVQLANGCIWNVTSILPLFNQLKSSAKIYDKITKSNEDDSVYIQKEKEFTFKNEIEVKNLYFEYEGKDILKDTSFKIEKGKKYLLKGTSGAGKSTLIKLLSMIYDDYKGEITVDGIDYREIKESSLNDKVSFIYQDVFLFEDTIYNNIALYKSYDEGKIQEAANKAGLDNLLQKKENGIHEMLMENGKNLSGGERQRISIARAIVKDCEILFVDEGTSSLDEELGRKVEETILSLDCTVIAISHRHYEGITEKYDHVLEIKNNQINEYNSNEYFMEVAI